MTPEEFEENARIVSGDNNFTLDNRIEDVTDSQHDWEDFWYFSNELGLSYQLDEETMLKALMEERPEFKNKSSQS